MYFLSFLKQSKGLEFFMAVFLVRPLNFATRRKISEGTLICTIMWNSSFKLNSKALCFYYNIQLQVEEPWFGIRGRCHPFANCRGIMGESWFLRLVSMTIIAAIPNEMVVVGKRKARNFSHTHTYMFSSEL